MEGEGVNIRKCSVAAVAVGLAIAVAGLPAQAQDSFLFENIPGVGRRPSVQIDLNQQMLGFVTAAAGAGGGAEAAELLAGIERVRVQVYEQLEDADAVRSFIDDASSALENDGWQPAVYVQDGDSRVRMYMQFDDDSVAGMTVMVADGSEAVFINIDGTIDPVVLGHLSRQIGIGGVMEGISSGILPAMEAAAGGQGTASDTD